MAALADSINSFVKWVYSAWDENAATAGGIIFIPCLLVAASLFPNQVVWLPGNVPCYWLFVDAVILCFTVAVIAACIDFAADLYCFFAKVHGDSVPMLSGRDNSDLYPENFNNAIFWALIIRVIGSTFILLVLTSATTLTLVPLKNTPANGNVSVSLPPQCDLLSDPVYHFKLFFGFGVVAVVFGVMRLAFVHQSRPSHHGHGDPEHDDHSHELPVLGTARDDDKTARKKNEESEESEDRDERRRKRHERRRREKKEKRERRRKEKKRESEDDDDDDDEEGGKDDNESTGAN